MQLVSLENAIIANPKTWRENYMLIGQTAKTDSFLRGT